MVDGPPAAEFEKSNSGASRRRARFARAPTPRPTAPAPVAANSPARPRLPATRRRPPSRRRASALRRRGLHLPARGVKIDHRHSRGEAGKYQVPKARRRVPGAPGPIGISFRAPEYFEADNRRCNRRGRILQHHVRRQAPLLPGAAQNGLDPVAPFLPQVDPPVPCRVAAESKSGAEYGIFCDSLRQAVRGVYKKLQRSGVIAQLTALYNVVKQLKCNPFDLLPQHSLVLEVKM